MTWPKGKPCSPETRAKISASSKGKRCGALNSMWKGGRCLSDEGYVLVLAKDHPSAMPNGYVREHRLVVEAVLGRYLEPHEVVHHINGNKTDNRFINLELTTQSDHVRHHNTGKRHSVVTRERISASNGAFYRTDEGREKQRQRALAK